MRMRWKCFRLKAAQASVMCGSVSLSAAMDPAAEGYTIRRLDGGDVVVRIHHRSGLGVTLTLRE